MELEQQPQLLDIKEKMKLTFLEIISHQLKSAQAYNSYKWILVIRF